MASNTFPVAVVGMAVRLPGAQSCHEFWKLIMNGEDTVSEFPLARATDIKHALLPFRSQLVNEDKPFFTGSFFESIDKFDADLFHINPREAMFIEPEQRIFLETVWELLEDAGYASSIRGSRTGVYVGNTVNKYKFILTENHPSISHGNHSPFISSRVSYTHDLHGPAMMVATGCSSSLLAVHLACQGLLSRDCEMAIAGGITLDLLPVSTKTDIWNQLGITGPNVRCRAFDASASGIAKGEGCGVVLLKPLHNAISDGDHIYGILEATTANQDGHSNGITAPHPGAQADMLHQVWKLANITPDNLEYFEAHGTGTELGDPIEISGITNAFKVFGLTFDGGSHGKIPIGSVKANIGHLADGGAGIVALIKTLLCMQNHKIPPVVNFVKPNPHINWETAPVYVNISPIEWKPHDDKSPRFASVSAFGLLGTNVHTVVKEYIPQVKPDPKLQLLLSKCNETQVLAMAAKTKQSLIALATKMAEYFKISRDRTYVLLKNVCYTINTGREVLRFYHRAIVYANTWDGIIISLEQLLKNLRKANLNEDPEQIEQATGYATSYTVLHRFSNDPKLFDDHTRRIAAAFLEGKAVSFNELYSSQDKTRLNKVPLLPTYAFERVRYWPKVGKPVNTELLQLEHKPEVNDSNASEDDHLNIHESVSNNLMLTEEFIQTALNEALSTTYEWNEVADENLFTFGVDSLICTQVNMKLQEELGCCFSIAEFHNNPTFNGLKALITAKLACKSQSNADIPSAESQDLVRLIEVAPILQMALNEALGKIYDWQKLQHENLFTLGVDSLIYTHVNMKLRDALGLVEPFTMAELHANPSYNELYEVIIAKLKRHNLMDIVKKCEIDRTTMTKTDPLSVINLYPLSFAQRRLWVMQEIATNPCAYNATNCLKISGNFHPAAFVLSANTVLSRHSAFYTIFVDTPDGPKQTHNWELQICVKELNAQTEDSAMKLYEKDYKTPFDLKEGPIVRCKLYHLPNKTYCFTMVVHHIIFDGWSHFVFYNELWDTYMKISEGKHVESNLHKPLFLEFAKEEQAYVMSSQPKIDSDLNYWKKKLSEPLPLTTLPGDKRRPPIFTHNGSRITHVISHDIIESLQQFSASSQYTIFTTLLSTVFVLIYHYTGDRDLIIGTPIAGRADLKSKHVIGCFVNTLIVRVQFKEGISFIEILEVVSNACLEAYDHQLAPFDHVVNHLNISRDTSITPVFSVNVCYHNTEMRAEHVNPPSEIKVKRMLLHNDSAKWDLYFDFLQEPEGMRFTVEYYKDFFSETHAECIVNNFLTLLTSVSQQPNLAISEINLARKQKYEHTSILYGATRSLEEKSLSVLLLESLQLHAETSSIIEISGTRIKYSELLYKAEELAVFMRESCSLCKQSRVGLLLGNSSEAIQSILACMLSGLVYVPLDSNNPKVRLTHICNEAELKALIFSKSHLAVANHLQWACPLIKTIFCVDADDFDNLQEEVCNTALMDIELWNSVASNAKNDIEGGGWKSSYTGEHMSVKEMNEYAENVLNKLKQFLNPQSKVLEIGCASGLTTQKLCQHVSHYVATDISQTMIERLMEKLKKEGVSNVELKCVPADQVGHVCHCQTFDVIVMNSVVHCFPGHNYLHKVLRICGSLLIEGGVVFIGDIMDLDLKEKLVASLKSFKEVHPEHRVKTEWNNELFLSRTFIQHLCDSSAMWKSVSCSKKFYTIPNELTDFRFDAIFMKSSSYKSDISATLDKETEYRSCAIKDVMKAMQSKDSIHETVSKWANAIHFEDEAYILYTSGTTGTPRGVIIGHEAMLNYVTWATAAYKFDAQTSIPLFSPLTFDFTITCIFPPLLSGSTIYVFKCFRDSYLDMASTKQLTTVKLSPIQLDTMLSATEEPLSASTYILGGEELTSTLLTKLKNNKPNDTFVVWNEYGPTEATVGCVVRCFTSEQLPLNQFELVCIGQPIDNVTVAVVRDNFKPVPIGGKGTLTIGGKCLCSDFAGTGASKEAKKSKCFSAACWGRPGEQMLLTDDIVEVMPATYELAYFGREKDCNTTKINGIRVDLMEIQHAIESNHLVHSAWVCSFVYENHTYLGAALKLKPSTKSKSDSGKLWKKALTSSLADSLPTRSIPKVFITVSEPPTNINGKKDVPFLQRLFSAEMQKNTGNCGSSVQDSSNSSSTLVSKLQRIWQSILPVNHLPNPDEDFFFDLSGDSLQAIHLVRKMRDNGFRVSVTDIFQNPSINKIIPILQKSGHEIIQQYNVTTVQENIWFKPTPILEEYITRSPSPECRDNFALCALLNFHAKVEVNILKKALRSVMLKHASLRSKFTVRKGAVLQQVVKLDPDQPKITEINITRKHDNLANEPDFISLCQQLEGSHSLSEGILLNAGIINIRKGDTDESDIPDQTYAILAVHHAAIDIVSWQQASEDLASALRQLSQDKSEEPILQSCSLPFSAYCEALHAEVTGIFASEVIYWQNIEKQCMESGCLVKNKHQCQFKSAKWLNRSIDASSLRLLSAKLDCSDQQILLTVFGRSMSLIHGQDKTAVCLMSHGRQLTTVDSIDTIGWCTSRFPFILDTPLTGDIIDQVKLTGEKIREVPNDGLGFGLLKSAGKVKMSHPRIMFVFQGSLDASTKKTFDGGDFKFDHIPWIEIMLNELKHGRFHRHAEDVLEFDLEIISWIHGGKLRFGCLFSKEVIIESLVEDIIKYADLNLKALARKAHAETKKITVGIIPSFHITPECIQVLQDALLHHNFSTGEMTVYPPEEALQALYKYEEIAADVTVIIPRHKTDQQVREFTEAYIQNRNSWKSGKVVIINAETITNSAKLPTEFLQNKDGVVLLPEFIDSKFYDSSSDMKYNMPLMQNGYTYLGLTIARAIRSTLCSTRYKVIAVDADYTLWNGECAEGAVKFSEANIVLHEFLLKMKNQGMLLVLLSKNSKLDVDYIFKMQQDEMALKKDDFVLIIANWEKKSDNIQCVAQLLNLNLDTFVFIDDSVLECEELISYCPQVFTLQFPDDEKLVSTFLNNLWILDNFNITSESVKRTEMYRNEFMRQEEVKRLGSIHSLSHKDKLIQLLSSWNMKLTICKTFVYLLKRNLKLHARAAELLTRTNQFKLNDVFTKLNEIRDEHCCWLVSLEDCHGYYGIISVVLLSTESDNHIAVQQWVMSCRALGRQVEHRILCEIHDEARRTKQSTCLQLAVNQTSRNIPTIKFLKSIGVETNFSGKELIYVTTQLPKIAETLHQVEMIDDVKAFEETVNGMSNSENSLQRESKSSNQPVACLREVHLWIEKQWAPSLKQQTVHHNMFPVTPTCKYFTRDNVKLDGHTFSIREHDLRAAWMEVLQSTKQPEEVDNFLKCGGNSFSAVFLVSKLRRICDIDINVMDLLQNPKYSHFKSIVLHAKPISDVMQEQQQYGSKCYPLTSAQQRMLIMQQTAPHSTAYVETIACYTCNTVKPAEVFKALAKQHPIMTSRIEMDNKSQMYVITINGELIFDAKPEEVADLKTAEGYLTKTIPVIQLVLAPLVKFRHLKVGDLSILVVHMHHAITDDITLTNILCDLQNLMCDVVQETGVSQQSFTCVDDEKNYFCSSQYGADIKFWNESFATIPPDVNLAILPKSESMWSDAKLYKARHRSELIPTETVEKITNYCNAVGVTNFQYYLACTSLLLQRYLGVDEITLAIPVTTRTDIHQRTEGLFVNTVLFRVVFDSNKTLGQYIKEVSQCWLQTLYHSQYPLDQVAKRVWKEHGKSVNSFCCVMFNYVSKKQSDNEIRVYSKHAKMPLTVDIICNDNTTHEVLLEWAVDLIDDGVAERLGDGVVTTCCYALDKVDNKLNEFGALSQHEYQLLQSFNLNAEEFYHKESLPIHRAFEESAALNPHALALVCGGVSLSYGQLNEIASRIACGILKKIGQSILKSQPIVVVMEKNEYAIASILGIWKAGGHFLPVASCTQGCLKDILDKCTPAAIVSNVSIQGISLQDENCLIMTTEDLIKHSLNEYELVQVKTSEDDLAYIIRTSGSTGRPKQCKISHRSLSIIASAWRQKYNMNKFHVNVLQWAPFSFDVFVGDLVRGLICAQGQLTLCLDMFRLDVPYILNLIKKHQITMVEVTPQFGLQIVENANDKELESLKLFILGSDVLQCHVYKKIKGHLNKHQRVINSYGMTEATIDSSFFEGNTIPKTRSGTIPIGKPLPGVTLHILNAKTLQLCPVGTVGELYICGDILASGDVEIVQLKHLDCWGMKTGDSACWLPSGDIELMGRLDDMVKLRGFRISTTEIANKIVEHVRGVKNAFVVPLVSDEISDNGIEFLCAFLILDTSANENDINCHVVCNQLKCELPYYMLPDIVQIVDRIPLTAHGKIDHKVLPKVSGLLELKSQRQIEKYNYKSPTASTLKQLFAEALGMSDPNQIHHNLTFMEQGGHSLILVRFSSLIKQKSTLDVGIADLFSYPSINALAEYIDEKNASRSKKYQQKLCERNEGQGNHEHIAVTGVGLRLPGGIMSLAQLWKVLEKGNDLIRDFPETRAKDVLTCLSASTAKTLSNADTFKGAFLEQIDKFDNQFFKIPPGEAKFMSPEQRLFLQVATEALAEGNKVSRVRGAKIGVFVGSSEVGYSQLNHPDEAICVSGLMPGMIATRVAYQWDLKGPTMLVDTACSSSLMALKQACESIKRNECEGALVGGISLVLYPAQTGVFGQRSILSPDFQCKAFDKDASGTAVGEGVLCLYVEPLSTALKDEKPVYGVIHSIASNSVGHGNGITAPTSISQQKVIEKALDDAQVNPSDITFIESHGTGTKLGDRIELSALAAVFKTSDVGKLPIGSVKSMFGHLDSAAGLLGVFKVLAMLMTKQITPTVHFKTPHPELVSSCLCVPTETIPWKANKLKARIAGVSSFGLTGTNCHAIIAEQSSSWSKTEEQFKIAGHLYPLIFSGKTMEQIRKQISLYKIYIQHLVEPTGNTFPGFCLTVAQRLKELADIKAGYFQCRMVIRAKESQQLLKIIDIIDSTQDGDALIQLAALRSDVHVYTPEFKEVKPINPAIYDYLVNGKINIEGLFPDSHCCIKSVPGVTVAMYNESRHWLEYTSASITETHEGLLDTLNKKLAETREMVRMLPLAPTQDLRETQAKFCAAIIIQLLLSTDLAEYLRDGRDITFQKGFALSGMLMKYEKLFFVMIRELSVNGLIEASSGDKSIHYLNSFNFNCQHFLDANPEAIANNAAMKYPLWADCFRFPLYCSKYLLEVLQGRMSPLSVIYPQGDLNFMYQFDKLGDLLGDVYYNMYMQVIAIYARQLSNKGEKVRVLEVGAGVGYVTRQLLPKLKDTPNIEYWFTDLGKAFVEHAKTLFSDYLHMMQFSTFDITKSAPKQGLLGSFDIVISYNVIHTTESVMDSVVNLKSCLGDDGVLFIIESAKNETWATLAWGILDGWWYFKDYDLRPTEPMLEPEKWERVLNEAGFGSVHSCPIDEYERSHVEKFLFLCSAKPLTDNTNSKLGWWESDANKFEPIKRDSELAEDEMGTATGVDDLPVDRQAVEMELKRIWVQLLGVSTIQQDDTFNSLGGESLLAIQMINLVRKRIGYQLEIADTFGYPTLQALANFIADRIVELGNANSVESSNLSSISTPTVQKISEQLAYGHIGVRGDLHTPNVFSVNEVEQQGTLLMFPGQGTQKVGMCISMKDSAEAKAIFKRAEHILGYNVLDICLKNDSELKEKLESTEFVQVSLLLGCIAKLEQLKVERPSLMKTVTHAAGLSIGEFAALVYTGVISFEDALKVVQARGKAMEHEVRHFSTGMVSVFGPKCDQLQQFIKEHFPRMYISTYLADNQHTVAGTEKECDALVEALSHKQQMEVIDVRKLRVAGAFHSPYMKPAAKLVDPIIEGIKFCKPSLPLIMNVNGQAIENPEEIKALICKQLVAAVEWKKSILTAYKSGVRNFLEISPSRVLSSIVKNRISECEGCKVEFIAV